ncbi:6890_t:CDS:2 [Paraglomus brasilianum]|uniref:6890_t:CDS:1 n=1 Tax=Paraglomus brasilianum TaxID=144538 RepID=A0A9N9BXA4_9GLOM|nr:6890_t:CDS:2 [Paraglomus brasilianum]
MDSDELSKPINIKDTINFAEIQDLIGRLPLDQPDEEIVSIVKNCESNESEDGDLETEPVSYAQAITFVDGIVSFLQQQPDGDFTIDNSFVQGLSKLKKKLISRELLFEKTERFGYVCSQTSSIAI